MVFSKAIKKLGKAQILNGLVHSNKTATIYYSKSGKVFSRTISMGGALTNDAYIEISGNEVLPLSEDFKLLRIGSEITKYE